VRKGRCFLWRRWSNLAAYWAKNPCATYMNDFDIQKGAAFGEFNLTLEKGVWYLVKKKECDMLHFAKAIIPALSSHTLFCIGGGFCRNMPLLSRKRAGRLSVLSSVLCLTYIVSIQFVAGFKRWSLKSSEIVSIVHGISYIPSKTMSWLEQNCTS
jgi:hypothetical protein